MTFIQVGYSGVVTLTFEGEDPWPPQPDYWIYSSWASSAMPNGWVVTNIVQPTYNQSNGQCIVSVPSTANAIQDGTLACGNSVSGASCYGSISPLEGTTSCLETGTCCGSGSSCIDCNGGSQTGPDTGGNLTVGSMPTFGIASYSGGSSGPGGPPNWCYSNSNPSCGSN